jgi:hypothetical protein
MKNRPEYISWQGMIQRCYNQFNIGYSNCGEKGIRVCDEWRNNFNQFYKDVGPRPKNKSNLGRLNKMKDYKPDNVKWMSKIELNRQTTWPKLTLAIANEIRLKAKTTRNYLLAREYNVGQSTICMILGDKTWRNIK